MDSYIDLRKIVVGKIWCPVMTSYAIDVLIRKEIPIASPKNGNMWCLFDYSIKKKTIQETNKSYDEYIFEGWVILR